MKKLPIGIQDFSELIEEGYLYVDKTNYIHELLQYKYYFLSRPRRFGKSLLLNTIKEIFLGNKKLFKNLWIYDKWNWKKTYPVIKISFSNLQYKNIGLAKAITAELDRIAKSHHIILNSEHEGSKFRELIEKLSEKEQVIVLIDEYDKPIIDFLEPDKIHIAKQNREVLKNFYSVVKDSDEYLRFFIITGVSKFSKVSVFSDLNNLDDITFDESYSSMLGYTQTELENYFEPYIKKLEIKYKNTFPDIMATIKEWYNGYSWDGFNFVYNPFSILNLFKKFSFDNYWFKTGTPTFLIKLVNEQNYTNFDFKNREVYYETLDRYELTNISVLPLLFQTGYLTIKENNLLENTYKLNYPNKEVERSFSLNLLAGLNGGKTSVTDSLLIDLTKALRQNETEKFISLLNIFYKGIAYTLIDNKEKYYHSIFYTVLRLIGFNIKIEELNIDGRIDATIITEHRIYIIEFKLDQNAEVAIKQIEKKAYAQKYSAEKLPISLLGINFNSKTKQIDDFKEVKYNK